MARSRLTAIAAVLVCLAPAAVVQLPAVAWQLADSLSSGAGDAARAAHGPRLHRGVKVRITGAAQGQLRPGTSVPVALSLHNPNRHRVQMKRVRVKIALVVAPHSDSAHPCTPADFRVRQMARRTLRLPARRSTDLASLGLPVTSWPSLTMLNRPTNQDGCKGATLRLRFKARGLHR